jgi:hypothetical protein
MNLETKTEDKTGIKKEGEDKKPGLNEDIEQCEKSLIIIKPDGVQKKVVGRTNKNERRFQCSLSLQSKKMRR